jgi:hypothetical protein
MALVDNIFSSIPGPLISQFGISAVYIKTSAHQAYDPESGTVLGISTEIPVKIVVSALKPEEMQGLYQQTDVKIIISADSLSGYYPQTTDSIRYTQNGVARTAKIVGMESYRGDNAIMHSVVARLS